MKFVHLHTHSRFSLLNGVADLEALAATAKRMHMPAVALTDNNNLYGAVSFYQKAKELGVKPIIGAELNLNDSGNIVVLVKNRQGYENLCELLSIGHLKGRHGNFLLPPKELFKRKEGLIILLGGHKSAIYNLLLHRKIDDAFEIVRKWSGVFSGQLYLELQQLIPTDILVNRRMIDFSQSLQVPIVSTNNVHFINRDDWQLHQILSAVKDNTLLTRVKTDVSAECYFKSSVEMTKLFEAYPEAIINTMQITENIKFEFSLGKPVFPALDLPENKTSFQVLAEKVKEGINLRYGNKAPETVKQRARKELRMIKQLGFPDYFLIVKDVVDFCNKNTIPCVGRGSAGDSLVAYTLGITQVDPLRYNLYFERFLNPERSDPPDIDLDICWKNRDRVLEYVYERFGHDHTAMICTYNTFQFRSSIRDVAKVYGIPEEEIKILTAYLPHYTKGNLRTTLENLPEYQHLRHQFHLYEQILEICEKLKDFPRHLSIHAGGIIIAPGKISHFLPLEEAGKGLVISQYDMYSVEKLGLVKMDFLGVRSLTIISDVIDHVRQLVKNNRVEHFEKTDNTLNSLPSGQLQLFPPHFEATVKEPAEIQTMFYTLNPRAGKIAKRNLKEYFSANQFPFMKNLSSTHYSILDLKSIPEDDASVIELLRNGKSMGCFQLESPGMRALLQKMQMKDMYDVIVSVALIRPGAANSGMKDVYIRRRAGIEHTTYIHPSLEKILKDTYGVVIYQEQVMQIAHETADISLAKADSLRRAMTKHRSKREINDLQKSFIEGLQKKDISVTDAARLWKYLLNFTGYGFNKAHSATYGMIAYQSAYLKRYFPVVFMTAVLNNHGGFYSKMAYIEEARRMGITILLPDINKSEKDFIFFENSIRAGFNSIYELSYKVIDKILHHRLHFGNFKDVFQFLKICNPAKHEAVNLAKCGALSSIIPAQPVALAAVNLFYSSKKNVNQARLLLQEVHLRSYSLPQRILYEMEILDFAVSAHPLTLYKDFLPKNSIHSFALLQHKNKTVTICGWVVTSRRIKTEKGEMMKFITLEDHWGMMEVVFFPDTYKEYARILHGHGPFVMQTEVQVRIPGELNLIAKSVSKIEIKKEEMEKALQPALTSDH